MRINEEVLHLSEELIEREKLNKSLKILYTYFKRFLIRCIDILGALVGLIICIPLTVVVAVKNHQNKDFGPIFFVQERIGKNGKRFKMFKYRTMVVGADDILFKYLEENPEAKEEYRIYKKLKNDPRITKFGEKLRKTSLDEFPQFINVLMGDMTLVGPRPYLPREIEDMGEYYEKIVTVKPGLTGLWQISGRSDVEFDNRLDLDVQYTKKRTIKNDMKILLITVLITLKRKGAI